MPECTIALDKPYIKGFNLILFETYCPTSGYKVSRALHHVLNPAEMTHAEIKLKNVAPEFTHIKTILHQNVANKLKHKMKKR